MQDVDLTSAHTVGERHQQPAAVVFNASGGAYALGRALD